MCSALSRVRTARPQASPQNAAPIPPITVPDAATTKVMVAASRPSVAVSAPTSEAARVPSRASPATVPITSGGARLTYAVSGADRMPSTR